MKLPKRIAKALSEKQSFIDSGRDDLEKFVIKYQSAFLKEILAELLSKLQFNDQGVLIDNIHNSRIFADIDNVHFDFAKKMGSLASGKILTTTEGIANLTTKYFTLMLGSDISERFDKIVEQTAKKINLRLGIDGGKIMKRGWMESFLKDNTLSTQVKNYVSKSITGQVNTKEFIGGLSQIITGDDKPGAMEKQYQRYAYDLYQQYDAAYNSTLADEFGMKYFIYQGGLINDSRDFCAAHNGKVWSIEESLTWPDWVPADGEYPEGYEMKSKNEYEHPSYMDYPGYQPLIDRGGYNCRHSIGFLTDGLAFDLRPELKDS